MQIRPSSSNEHLNSLVPLPQPAVAPGATRQAMDLDATIEGYYSHLKHHGPLYAGDRLPNVRSTTAGLHILDQLRALNEKATALLAEHRQDGTPALRDLSSFILELHSLSDEECQYFYSKPFKGKFEQIIATADCASAEDREAAMSELEAFGTLLRDPSRYFMANTGTTVPEQSPHVSPTEPDDPAPPTRPPLGLHYPLA